MRWIVLMAGVLAACDGGDDGGGDAGDGGGDTPSAPKTFGSQEVAGSVEGAPWSHQGGVAYVFGDQIEFDLYDEPVDCDNVNDAIREVYVIGGAPAATGEHTASEVGVTVWANGLSYSTTDEAVRIDNIGDTVQGALWMVWDGDTNLQGTFEVPVCP